MAASVRRMFHQWRDEVAKGRDQVSELGERMTLLVWKMIQVAFVGGIAVGALVGGLIAWVMMR